MHDLGIIYDKPTAMPMEDGERGRKHYPTLCISCDDEIDIPESGTAVIKFRKVEDTENTRDPEDPKYRYELEVQGIDIKDGEDVSLEMKDPADELEKAMNGDDEDEE